MKTKSIVVILLAPLTFATSCKHKEVKTSPVEFYLMDSPTNYDSVNIHVQKIEAQIVGDSTRWLALQTKDTLVNLLHFQDSVTLLVARGKVPLGLLKEIRFVLGNDNSVAVSGVTCPLQIPREGSHELTIPIDKKLNEVFNGFILDFDASQSIVEDNGSFWLQPVVRIIQ